MNRFAALLIVCFLVWTPAGAQESPHGTLSVPCTSCHSPASWKMRDQPLFNHDSTGFRLLGQHRFLECRSCHADLKFSGTQATCAGCHTDIHNGELGSLCGRCHGMESWTIGDMRQRHQLTRFPLVGRHLDASCENCHERATTYRYAGTSTACIACHRTEYLATVEPSHSTMGFDVDCSTCHKPASSHWPGSFDHGLTAFPLTGAHRALLCSQCHPDNQFTARSSDCYSCHAGDYNRAAAPVHLGFSQACATCHTTVAWSPSTFDHSATRFPLSGAHAATPCQDCHIGGNFQLTYLSCIQCHDNDYRQATNPNHLTNAIGPECRSCHTTTAWRPATYDHAATRFPLTGAHYTTPCLSCHVGGNYQITYTDCYQCHQADFERPTDPNHVTALFNHGCLQCHTTTAWTPATFDHNTTRFALTGAHIATPCVSCHVAGNYQLSYTDCYQCHQADFERPADPNHVSALFSHNCLQCHTTTAWTPASFDHSTTAFPLTGAHVSAACQSCHVNGNYQLTYTDCYQCHRADYESVVDPNHVLSNLDHNCTSCHTTTAWLPSTYNHDTQSFRIYSAKHLGLWTTCADCHNVPGNYQAFTCLSCHKHNKTDTDASHTAVSGYSYVSAACYTCHRNI